MWLERFAGPSRDPTPSATPPRTFSPAPRRSIQLGPSTTPRRPAGVPTRSSSLTASAYIEASGNTVGSARVSNGSGLKEQLESTSGADNADPLDVLSEILGSPKQSKKEDGDGARLQGSEERGRLARNIDFGDLSLDEFAARSPQVAQGQQDEHVRAVIVQDFQKEKDKFVTLRQSVHACDEVLQSVETYLTSFRADLAAVSAEIESLQHRSKVLNDKLQNCKAVEAVLGPDVESIGIPPAVVRKITEGPVDAAWFKALQDFNKRSKAMDAKLLDGRDIKAAKDMQPFVKDVSTKAVERIRDYLVAQIKALRSPGTNAQITQQKSLLRYKDLFSLMHKEQSQLAEDISQAYVNTMRWYYLHNFSRYKTALDKLTIHAIDQSETIASESAPRRTGRPAAPRDIFSIGRRRGILDAGSNAALPAFAAEDDKGLHFLEVPYREFNLALLDNASAEYLFLTEFFSHQPPQATNRIFHETFQPTFELGQSLTRQLIEQTLDALGILMCVRLTQAFAFELQRRKVPVLETYINGTNMLLWPRFQQIMDAHCESLRKLTASLPGKPAGSALSLTSTPSTTQTTAPHMLTQRFANFAQAILTLSSESGDDEPVANSLTRLRNEFEAFLVKFSKSIAEQRKRDRFLFNNYSLVCTIIGDGEGKLATELQSHYGELRDTVSVE